jgi:hypothetical protein
MALSPRVARASRAATLSVAAIVALTALTACGASSGSTGTPTPIETASATPTATETPAATAAPTSDAVISSPVGVTCDQLLTLQDVYDYNPNYTALPAAKPAVDSKAGQIAGMNGLTCQWKNNTSESTIDLGLAKLTDDQLTSLKNIAFQAGGSVPTYGDPASVEGYFNMVGAKGQAQVFTGSYWLTLSSDEFLEPGDAQQLLMAAIPHLPAS